MWHDEFIPGHCDVFCACVRKDNHIFTEQRAEGLQDIKPKPLPVKALHCIHTEHKGLNVLLTLIFEMYYIRSIACAY